MAKPSLPCDQSTWTSLLFFSALDRFYQFLTQTRETSEQRKCSFLDTERHLAIKHQCAVCLWRGRLVPVVVTDWCCQWWYMSVKGHLWPRINSTLTFSLGEASVPLKPWPPVPSHHHRGSAVTALHSKLCKMPHCVPSILLCAELNNVHYTSPQFSCLFPGNVQACRAGVPMSSLSVVLRGEFWPGAAGSFHCRLCPPVSCC